MNSKYVKTMLIIGGSDSIGGAGIQAHIKCATLVGVNCVCAITCVTAQNYNSVTNIEITKPKNFDLQLKAIIDENIKIDITLVSLLPSIEIIKIVSKRLNDQKIILDPVFISKAGHRFIENDLINLESELLFKKVYLITPNLYEFSYMLNIKEKEINKDNILYFSKKFLDKYGGKRIIVKNIPFDNFNNFNFLYDSTNSSFYIVKYKRLTNKPLHGTGCMFASFLSSFLVKDNNLSKSLKKATKKVWNYLKNSNKANFPGINIYN